MVRACSKTRQPARRPNLGCALLRPVSQSGPRTGTCHPVFGNVLWRPGFLSCAHADDALESQRAYRARLMGAAETHLPPNRPQITTLGAPIDVRILVFSVGLGGKGESADRAESRPRSTMVPAKFPGCTEPGDVQNTITPMFGGNMHEKSCNVSTTLWSPDARVYLWCVLVVRHDAKQPNR